MEFRDLLEVSTINDTTVKKFEGINKYVATGDVDDDKIINYEKVTYESKPSRANRQVEIGDILVAKMKDTKKVLRITQKNYDGYIYSTGFTTLKAKPDILNKDYFYLILKSEYFQKQKNKYSKGATQKSINNTGLKKIKIPVPSIDIQKEVVRILNKSQELLDNRKKQINLLDDLIESIFYTTFGNVISNSKKLPEIRLDEICHLKAGKFIKASDILDSYENGTYPCYGGNGLRGYVSEYTHEGSYPLIGRQGALCGNINFASGKFYATEHAIVVRPTVDLDIYWLYTMLEMMDLNRLASGAAQPGLNVGTLKNLVVIYPSIESQNEFGIKFREIKKLKESMENSLIEIKSNYNSIIQKFLKGELFKC